MEFIHYNDLSSRHPITARLTKTCDARFSLRPAPRIFFGVPSPKFATWYFGDRGVQESGVLSINDLTLRETTTLISNGVGFNIPQCGLNHHSEVSGGDKQVVGVTSSPKNMPGEWVILPGAAFSMYGHWLVDFLPRLYNLVELGHQLNQLSFLLPTSLPEVNRSWLTLLGIRADQIVFYDPATEYCHVEHALIPFGLRGNSRAQPLFSKAARWMNFAEPHKEKSSTDRRKLFVSRSSWGNASRILSNEDELAAYATSVGFEIVVPETLSIKEQVELFATASIIVGDYGSAMHNSIFSQEQSFVLALRSTFGHPGFLQSGLCEVLKQDCGYIFGATTGSEFKQSYHIELDDFKLCLDLIMSLQR